MSPLIVRSNRGRLIGQVLLALVVFWGGLYVLWLVVDQWWVRAPLGALLAVGIGPVLRRFGIRRPDAPIDG